MDNTINQAQSASGVSYSEMSGNCSVQMAFAMLQMSMGELMKENAMGYIEDIQEAQQQAKEISEAIEELRNLKSAASTYTNLPTGADLDNELAQIDSTLAELESVEGSASNDKTTTLSQESTDFILNTLKTHGEDNFEDLLRGNDNEQFLYEIQGGIASLEDYKAVLENYKSVLSDIEALGVDTTPIESDLTTDNIEIMIENLESKSETATSSIQQQMVFVQDYIGQYNSYVQGASTAISDANSVLTNLARGQ